MPSGLCNAATREWVALTGVGAVIVLVLDTARLDVPKGMGFEVFLPETFEPKPSFVAFSRACNACRPFMIVLPLLRAAAFFWALIFEGDWVDTDPLTRRSDGEAGKAEVVESCRMVDDLPIREAVSGTSIRCFESLLTDGDRVGIEEVVPLRGNGDPVLDARGSGVTL